MNFERPAGPGIITLTRAPPSFVIKRTRVHGIEISKIRFLRYFPYFPRCHRVRPAYGCTDFESTCKSPPYTDEPNALVLKRCPRHRNFVPAACSFACGWPNTV